ncbi:unnamed protein product [Moneuplotes crassus]|uniref:Uncharacterized protein n=1 Tax=Euplotes crassus TaxID=5936 RepID=A0AAD1X6H0_EUPCR|nr:unnamed protein product [Moneuplotes crassus]
MACTRKHHSLHLDSVLGFFEVDDVSCVDEDMHDRRLAFPFHPDRFGFEVSSEAVLFIENFIQHICAFDWDVIKLLCDPVKNNELNNI